MSKRSSLAFAFLAVTFADAALAGAGAMTFRTATIDGHPAIVAVGPITLDTPADFAALGAVSGTSVFIDSPGGNVGAAVRLGSLFRRQGIEAVIAGVTETGVPVVGACYSACVYALVGALHRSVPGRSRVGIHRMRANFEDSGADPAAIALDLIPHMCTRRAESSFGNRWGIRP